MSKINREESWASPCSGQRVRRRHKGGPRTKRPSKGAFFKYREHRGILNLSTSGVWEGFIESSFELDLEG